MRVGKRGHPKLYTTHLGLQLHDNCSKGLCVCESDKTLFLFLISSRWPRKQWPNPGQVSLSFREFNLSREKEDDWRSKCTQMSEALFRGSEAGPHLRWGRRQVMEQLPPG